MPFFSLFSLFQYQEWEKSKQLKCVCFCFHLYFLLLKFLISKFKKAAISKYIFHTLSYITLVTTKLTNLEELSFRTVFALPNVSKTGLVCTTWSSRLAFLMFPSLYSLAPTVAKYEMTFLVFSVFPAPDSPLKLHFILYYIQTKIVIEPESWSKKPNSVSTQDSACL